MYLTGLLLALRNTVIEISVIFNMNFTACIYDFLQEMAKILKHPRVYSFLHVPVQSASDNVLADMKREYCVDDFRHVVDFLKDK